MTRDEDINLESGEYLPVGHIWKFDLEKTFGLDFGLKCNFSKKTRIEHVMLKFLATIENTRKIKSEDLNQKPGKVNKNNSGKLLIAIFKT